MWQPAPNMDLQFLISLVTTHWSHFKVTDPAQPPLRSLYCWCLTPAQYPQHSPKEPVCLMAGISHTSSFEWMPLQVYSVTTQVWFIFLSDFQAWLSPISRVPPNVTTVKDLQVHRLKATSCNNSHIVTSFFWLLGPLGIFQTNEHPLEPSEVSPDEYQCDLNYSSSWILFVLQDSPTPNTVGNFSFPDLSYPNGTEKQS